MEKIDQVELARYLKTEKTKQANEVLTAVKEDLQTEQGQLLLRVLTLVATVNEKNAKQQNFKPANEKVVVSESPFNV